MGYDPIEDVELKDVTESELRAKGVMSLATRPNAPSRYGEGGLTAEALKAKFDGLARALADRINNIHKYLRADDLAENIKVFINAVGIKTLAALANDIGSGEAAKYFTVAVGANEYKSLQEAIFNILKDVATTVYRADINTIAHDAALELVFTFYDKTDKEISSSSVFVQNAEYYVYNHNNQSVSDGVHPELFGLIQSNGMQIESIDETVEEVEAKVDILDKKVENLRAALSPEYFTTDSAVAHIKPVPAAALPFAEVHEVGGMSHRSVNLFDDVILSSKGMEKVSAHEYLSRQPYATSGVIYTNATKEAGVFTFSALLKFASASGVTSAGIYCQVLYTDGTTTKYPVSSVVYDRYFAYSFATNSAKVVDNIQFTYGSNNIATYIKDVMIVKGSEAIPFAPFYEGIRNAAVTALESEGANVSPITTPQSGYFYDTSGGQSGANASYICFIVTDVKELTEYTVQSNLVINSVWFDDGGNPMSRIVDMRTFTTPVGCKRLRITLRNTSGAADTSAFEWFMVNYGKETLPYTPYVAKHILPIPAEVQALDGWGMGTDYKNYNRIIWGETKEYRKETASIDLGALTWTAQANNVFNGSFGLIAPPASYPERTRGVLTADYVNSTSQATSSMPDKSILRFDWGVAIRDTAYTDAAAFRAAVSGKTMLYAVKTPTVINLVGILPDDNFIEVSGGGTVTAVNENGLAAPTKIEYQLKEATA